jgi:hypothetical protein
MAKANLALVPTYPPEAPDFSDLSELLSIPGLRPTPAAPVP